MIITITGASASGKDYLCKALKDYGGLDSLISDTTRKKRPGEKEGVNYYYKNISEFQQNLKDNQYVEYDEYSEGRFYGLSKKELDKVLSNGKNQVVVVTPNGYRAIKDYIGKENILSVYISAPVGERAIRYINRMGIDNVKLEDINEMTRRINCDYGMFLGFEKEADICLENDKNNNIIENVNMICQAMYDKLHENYESER